MKKYLMPDPPERYEIIVYQDDNLFTAELRNSFFMAQGKTFKSSLDNLCKLIKLTSK